MAACSQEAGLENVSGVKIQHLCDRWGGGGGAVHPTSRKRPVVNHDKGRNMKTFSKKTFQKVKRLCNLGRHVCASGSRNNCTDETMGGTESIHSSVCVSGVWSTVKLVPRHRASVCVFANLFVCDCIPDTRHNYLVIFVKILIFVIQQVLHRLLAIATDEREKKDNFFKKVGLFVTVIKIR